MMQHVYESGFLHVFAYLVLDVSTQLLIFAYKGASTYVHVGNIADIPQDR